MLNSDCFRIVFITISKFESRLTRFWLLLPLLVFFQLNFNAYAQNVLAPNQCLPTPSFPVGTIADVLNCPSGEIPIPIYTENLDIGFGDFTEDATLGGPNDLTISTAGDTPSAGTGPETTASCNGTMNVGEFVFLEGSSTQINETHCMTNTIDLTDASPPLALSFWYHMFGDNIGDLSVNINDAGPVLIASGQQQTANGQAWQQANINLNDHSGLVFDVQVCMSEGNGANSSFKSDISVDQFEIYGCGVDQSSCFVTKTADQKVVTFCL